MKAPCTTIWVGIGIVLLMVTILGISLIVGVASSKKPEKQRCKKERFRFRSVVAPESHDGENLKTEESLKHYSVVPEMSSGLGNQLFKLSAAIAVASRTNKKVVLCRHGKDNVHVSDKDKYLKTIFRSFEMIDTMPSCGSPGYFCIKLDGPFVKWDTKDALLATENIAMDGYFQYLPAIAPFEKEIIKLIKRDLPERRPENAVGIHVRRGDYISFSFSLIPLTYFKHAMDLMRERLSKTVRFILFTNDLAWCQEQDIFKECTFNEEEDDVACLADMAACKLGFIVTNSTYSWWGAFLGAHEAGGLVCAPSIWIRPSINTTGGELFPKSWHILNAA